MFKRNIIILLILFLSGGYSYTEDFDISGKVESVRKDRIITILFEQKPEKERYLIIDDDTEIGRIRIISINTFVRNSKLFYRTIAEYDLNNNKDTIIAGSIIGLVKEKGNKDEALYKEDGRTKFTYKKIKITEADLREMILIPAGQFLFGSNDGDRDEQPQKIIPMENFYIDKYEVSNSDYYIFVSKTNAPAPISWTGGGYKTGEDDFPVLVSYYEAVRYAEWAGKRLPLEEEWEKAARGNGIDYFKQADETFAVIEKPVIYPWGNIFDPLKANSIEFWESSSGNEIKKNYSRGLLPVYSFKGAGDSIYGVVNMAGNAAEWTSSWYRAYNGSKYSNKMFGTQVKVIRGGTWYSNRDKLRASNREIGGLPNLYDDNLAGFRCAKDPTIVDIIK